MPFPTRRIEDPLPDSSRSEPSAPASPIGTSQTANAGEDVTATEREPWDVTPLVCVECGAGWDAENDCRNNIHWTGGGSEADPSGCYFVDPYTGNCDGCPVVPGGCARLESAIQRVAGILQSVVPEMPTEEFKNLCVLVVAAADPSSGPPWIGQARAEVEREHADLNGTMDRGDSGC